MVNYEQAKDLAHTFINEMYNLGDNDEILIIDEHSQETSDAWVFRYDSRQYLETGNPLFMVQVEFPIYVAKTDGDCQLQMVKH